MKVERQPVQTFYPVTVTFETKEELELMRDVIWHGFTQHGLNGLLDRYPQEVVAFADKLRSVLCPANIPGAPCKKDE